MTNIKVMNKCMTISDKQLFDLVETKSTIVFNSCKGFGFYELGDLISEAATKVWKNLDSFNASKSPLDAWVYCIVKRTWLDMLDKERRRADRFEPIVKTYDESESGVYGSSSNIESGLDVDFILSKVKSLPNDYRKVMEKHIEGFDNDEIAVEYGYSKGKVATMLCRARKLLGKAF